MLHALALTATLLMICMSLRQIAQDVLRYVLNPRQPQMPSAPVVLRRARPARFIPAAVAVRPSPRAVRLAA